VIAYIQVRINFDLKLVLFHVLNEVPSEHDQDSVGMTLYNDLKPIWYLCLKNLYNFITVFNISEFYINFSNCLFTVLIFLNDVIHYLFIILILFIWIFSNESVMQVSGTINNYKIFAIYLSENIINNLMFHLFISINEDIIITIIK